MDMSALMVALERLVLERLPDGQFVRHGALPAWCLKLACSQLQATTPFSIDALFPFLDSFLSAAELAWRGESDARASSGFWTEVGSRGQEIHLEALAVRVDEAKVLVVAHDDRVFRQQQHILQRARLLRLSHDALLREMERKDVLLHTIIHELAAPLHTILGMLSLLDEIPRSDLSSRSGDRAELGVQAIRRALAAAREQKQVISEVLEAFSAEHEPPAVALAHAPDVHVVIDRVARERGAVADRRSISLEVAPQASRRHVIAEQNRLIRVLIYLVDNALCRSPAGGTVGLTDRRRSGP